jgi:hypothetical protein
MEWCSQPSLLERDENRRNALLLTYSHSLPFLFFFYNIAKQIWHWHSRAPLRPRSIKTESQSWNLPRYMRKGNYHA